MVNVLSNERPTKEIKIQSKDEEWVRRLVSKLLLSGNRFHVLWSNHQITIRVNEENVYCLAKKITAPTFHYGMTHQATAQFEGLEEWTSWNRDSRFMDYLLNDERFEFIKISLSTVLESGKLNMDEWIEQSAEWKQVVSDMYADIEEGSIGDKMASGGWF